MGKDAVGGVARPTHALSRRLRSPPVVANSSLFCSERNENGQKEFETVFGRIARLQTSVAFQCATVADSQLTTVADDIL